MYTPYHVILFGAVIITGIASIFQMSAGEDGLVEPPAKSSESKFNLNTY